MAPSSAVADENPEREKNGTFRLGWRGGPGRKKREAEVREFAKEVAAAIRVVDDSPCRQCEQREWLFAVLERVIARPEHDAFRAAFEAAIQAEHDARQK